ncbi:hypothetical protein SAMN05444166_3296 [Singulisphaera sp. GP187]|uniref:hypothetical protein n=1 Tax=Singulisphaera sp. GP187 TaxID=1882752 RepID=UPI00092B9939|nr:hypothetical protein [Singulisphaera sp. GP187]SIO25894.1 hypothetical protein SAMN05444166_3296 [Singulisphaera sp. GP187]
MLIRRWLPVGLTLLGMLGVTAVWAQKEEAGSRPKAPARRLDPDTVSVRLLLGVGDRQRQTWSGQAKVDQGEILGVEGYRFRKGDKVTGNDSWQAKSLLVRKVAAKKAGQGAAKKKQQQVAAKKQTGPGTPGPNITPNGVIVSLKAPPTATLSVETEHGVFKVRLADLADGLAHPYLDGRANAQRVPDGVTLLDSVDQEDFPAAAADANGAAWVAFVVHQARGPSDLESFASRPKTFAEYAPKGGGDQVRLFRFADGKADEPLDVTQSGLDVWRPAVAVDRTGKVIVVWSENEAGNWDLYRRVYDPEKKSWSETKRLTTNPGTDTDVVLARAPDGKVWMAWQSWIKGQADILVAEVDGDSNSKPLNISNHPRNDWSPSLSFDKNGRIFVAFDSYRAGNYDVLLWSGTADGGRLVSVAGSAKYEARPTLTVDPRGRAWVAYEERDPNWGKDAENLVDGKGSTLYRSAAVRVRCVDGDRVLDAPDPLANAADELRPMNSYPRISLDRDGRIWLAFRHRQESIWGGPAVMVVGALWVEHVTALAGKAWEPPLPLSRSDGLLDHRPALVAPSDGPLLAFYSSDGRLRREVEFNPELNRKFWTHQGTPSGADSAFNEDLQVAALTPLSKGGSVDPTPTDRVAAEDETPDVHPDESADVSRMRDHRIQAGGKTYRLIRGDFHRHTEISMDGGSDGSLEDMWRYALDAASFDWMGNADHDNGGGKEYTWWLVQKTTDLYNGEKFTSMFTYERSNAYPHGHRNVMFAQRGIRTLPRLVDETGVVDEDTPMLYDYLKEHNGLCASHTSGTGMGTDWRDVNPEFEPMVEIFQGHRNSYEYLGAPRVARRPGEAIGGWKPLGMVWNALALQYKLGFQASSDHISTHISYAIAIAEDSTREAIFDAFKRRHCYGATDNILLDVRSGEHIMGDEFTADGPVRLKIKVQGTAPIARVDIIKDFRYAYSTEPNRPQVEFEWQDEEKRPAGLSWYYVRVLQTNGELAWGSPFWVHLGDTGASR